MIKRIVLNCIVVNLWLLYSERGPFRGYVADVFTDVNEEGPFSSCVREVRDFIDNVQQDLILARGDANPTIAQMFKRNFVCISIVLGKFFSCDDARDTFALLHEFSTLLEDQYEKISKQNPTNVNEAARRFVDTGKGRADLLRSTLIGHPIIIVFAAFLLDNHMLYDFGRLPASDKKGASWITRDSKSFLSTFPYDYLACVYKMSVDAYLRHRVKFPLDEDFADEESNMIVYRRRAINDVKNV